MTVTPAEREVVLGILETARELARKAGVDPCEGCKLRAEALRSHPEDPSTEVPSEPPVPR